jgi:hypothetical protein
MYAPREGKHPGVRNIDQQGTFNSFAAAGYIKSEIKEEIVNGKFSIGS